MSHVYVVVATREAEVEVCETFSGVQSALGRAFQLASDKSGRGRTDLFNHSPGEETLPDGSIRWVFMDTNKQSVIVCYRKIEDALLDSRDPNNLIGGLSNVKSVSKDVVPSGFGIKGNPYAQSKPVAVSDDVPLVYPPRGTLHTGDGLVWDSLKEGWISLPIEPAPRPIHDTPKSIDVKDDFKWVDASIYIKDGLPYGAGGNLAKALLDMHLTKKDWDKLVIDITKLPTELVTSSFFNAFLQMISDLDQNQDLLDFIRTDSTWHANFDFQFENIERWMNDFKPAPPPFDFMDRTLPAGWNVDEKPILLGQFLDDPDNVKDPLFELTEDQKWALVKARIRKSPHFAVDLSGMIPARDIALKAVEDQTDFGRKVRDADLQKLSGLLSELIDGTLKSF